MAAMTRIKIAIVGLGKIARDQHVPALAANEQFELAAVASPHNRLEGLPHYSDVEALLRAVPEVSTVALCTTPQARYDTARYALQQGRHVLLEKPPGMTVSEVLELVRLATNKQLALFATWHSHYGRAVQPARKWLAERTIRSVRVDWKEDVRVWHPGQTWIWRPGGLGVFDPGINALSILTRIIPGGLILKDADLSFPSNCQTPIAASVQLVCADGAPVHMQLDFRHAGTACWDITVDTDGGRLQLLMGGNVMQVDDQPVATAPAEEYPGLYAHFAQLVRAREIDVDLAPLQLVADAFLCGRRVEVEPFVE
jgi:D-galactose 1-dehydrogenase